jgi:hypothetical protein
VSGVAIEVLSMRSTARLILAFILNVTRQTLSLNLYVLLWNTTVSELCVSLFWINVGRNRLRRLLAQVKLAIRVEVVVAIDPY